LSKVNGFEAKLKVFFGFVEEPPIRGAFSGEVEFWQSDWEGLSKVQTADHEVEDGWAMINGSWQGACLRLSTE